jgi:hypothetical protein
MNLVDIYLGKLRKLCRFCVLELGILGRPPALEELLHSVIFTLHSTVNSTLQSSIVTVHSALYTLHSRVPTETRFHATPDRD